jgi:hypothetical protein
MPRVYLPPLIVLFSVLLLAGCAKTSLDKLISDQNGGNTVCDTVQMKYSTDIVPILQAHCYVCHGNGSTGGSGGINLDGYANIKAWIDKGYVLPNVRHEPGFNAMPYQMAKLDTCTINKIADWIYQGAPDN